MENGNFVQFFFVVFFLLEQRVRDGENGEKQARESDRQFSRMVVDCAGNRPVKTVHGNG